MLPHSVAAAVRTVCIAREGESELGTHRGYRSVLAIMAS